MRAWILAGLFLFAGCPTELGARDGSAFDASAFDASVAMDAPRLDVPGLDVPGLDAPASDVPAPDVPTAPDVPAPIDAPADVGPAHPFGPCGCEVCPCPAAGTTCDFPQGIPDEAFTGAAAYPTLHDEVNAAMAAITGCSVGSACPHGYGPEHAGAQPFFDVVIAELRARGFCAGQHRTGETDEIAVSRNCRAIWEGYHIAAYGGGTVVWARHPSVPCGGSDCPRVGGGSFRGIWWVPTGTCP